ncbi:MAG: tRNA (guanosine(37)-N1)-methyltransferase TrmD [Candidatus Moraniibacteriota bacterium]
MKYGIWPILNMRFDIISIFPEAFLSYFDVSILKRAREDGKIEIEAHNLRDWAHDKHRTTDDTPYGGGAGMVMKVEPIAECLETLQQKFPEKKTRTILFSAKGRRFTQKDARRFLAYDRLILIAGRYEGVDERVAEHLVDEELSIGDFVLTGGELPAMVVVDSVARLIPGVLGNSESALDESFSDDATLEYPQYTKPEEFRGWRVPEVLVSGHHAEIEKWRRQNQKTNTTETDDLVPA